MTLTKEKGFTLIELLVVIAIIGILAGIVLVSMGGARSQARDVKRMSDLRQLISAQELYYGNNEAYVTGVTADGTPAISTYLAALDDPQAPSRHYRWLDNTSCDQNFCAYAVMENKGDCSTARWFVVWEGGSKEVCDKTEPANGCNCSSL